MASKNVWFMRDAELKIDNLIAAVSGSTSLESQLSATGTWTSRVKNVKLELGDMDISPINVMGIQQLKQEDRPQIVTLTFNTVMYPQGSASNTTLYDFLFGAGASVGATGYFRYGGGEKASGYRTDMAVLVKCTRPGAAVSSTISFLLNNANAISGPVSADAEGHFEQEWTVKCLACDLYIDTGVSADPSV